MATTTRRTRNSRSQSTSSAAKAQPEQEPKQEAAPVIDLNPAQVTVWKPVVSLNGNVHTCPHSAYGHENEMSAAKCARSLVNKAKAAAKTAA